MTTVSQSWHDDGMEAGGDTHKTAINSRCQGTIESDGEASNATESRAACRKVGACRLAKHPGLLADTRSSSHLIRSLFCICAPAVSYHSFILFCPSLLRSAASFLLLHISRLAFSSSSCLFPKHPQRPAPAFSTFQLAAAPDYAADTHRERLC
jgi:hypothetical protein